MNKWQRITIIVGGSLLGLLAIYNAFLCRKIAYGFGELYAFKVYLSKIIIWGLPIVIITAVVWFALRGIRADE